MIDLELFHFLRPQWFVAALPLALLIWFLFFRRGAQSNWEALVDEPLLPHILIKGVRRTRRVALLSTAAGGLLGIVALAGPVWEKLPQPVFTTQDALVIALDLTRSMDAADVSPSRLERARYKIRDILDQRHEGQTALLVYTGEVFTVTPLTDDGATIKSQLNALDTDIMPVTGNRTDRALDKALDLLKQAGMRRGHVLLITDAADPDRAEESVRRLRNEGYRLSILGVGTRHGAPVLLPDGGFLQGKDGEIVIPVLDESALRRLAAAGGGMYVRLTKDDQDTSLLTGNFSAAHPDAEQAGTGTTADVWREQGPWLVLCLLPLAALLFRRGYIFVLAAVLLAPAEPVYALDWEGLWSRNDQRGQRAMDARDYEAAAEWFDDPAWKAAAQHRAEIIRRPSIPWKNSMTQKAATTGETHWLAWDVTMRPSPLMTGPWLNCRTMPMQNSTGNYWNRNWNGSSRNSSSNSNNRTGNSNRSSSKPGNSRRSRNNSNPPSPRRMMTGRNRQIEMKRPNRIKENRPNSRREKNRENSNRMSRLSNKSRRLKT